MLKKIVLFGFLIVIKHNLCAQNFGDIATQNNLIGMSVVAVCNSEVVENYSFGLSDIQRNIYVSEKTLYRIASISKTITSVALLTLYEQGFFNLDDDVSDFLGFNFVNPNFEDKKITFRMLLSHTSSLKDGAGYTDFLNLTYNQIPPPNIKELVLETGNYYTSDIWQDNSPGTYFMYSNLNYGIIGTLIEKISGLRFDIFVKQNILEPLNIRGSFNVDDIENIDEIAVLYRNSVPITDNYQGVYPEPFNSDLYEIGSNGLVFAPQGGLRISALDLSKFMLMLLNGGIYNNVRIIENSTVDLILEPQWTFNGNNGDNYYNLFNQWGLGFHITTNQNFGDIVFDEITMFGHPGEAYGLISDMYFDKIKKFGFIFITNGYSGNSYYEYGDLSSFYLVEEQIFGEIKNEFYNFCQSTTNIQNKYCFSDEDILFDFEEKKIILNNCLQGKYSVFDIQGNLLESCSFYTNTLDLKHLRQGFYLIKVETENQNFTKKFFID